MKSAEYLHKTTGYNIFLLCKHLKWKNVSKLKLFNEDFPLITNIDNLYQSNNEILNFSPHNLPIKQPNTQYQPT